MLYNTFHKRAKRTIPSTVRERLKRQKHHKVNSRFVLCVYVSSARSIYLYLALVQWAFSSFYLHVPSSDFLKSGSFYRSAFFFTNTFSCCCYNLHVLMLQHVCIFIILCYHINACKALRYHINALYFGQVSDWLIR